MLTVYHFPGDEDVVIAGVEEDETVDVGEVDTLPAEYHTMEEADEGWRRQMEAEGAWVRFADALCK